MTVQDQTVISIRYKMKNGRGETIEDIMDGLPISYLHGRGTILSSLEAELNGLKVGDCKSIFISKTNGYDNIDDDFYIDVIVDNIRAATADELKNGLLPRAIDENCNTEDCC